MGLIVPVLDILDGQAVHAVRGERHAYQPLKIAEVTTSSPLAVAHHYREVYGFHRLYLADLDAIIHGQYNYELYNALLSYGWELWLDCGLRSLNDFAALDSYDGILIIGTETWNDWDVLDDVVSRVGTNRVFLSLDFHGNHLITPAGSLAQEVGSVVNQAWYSGVRNLLFLDLSRVGTSEGLNCNPIWLDILRSYPWSLCAAGGGVKDSRDIHRLYQAGFDAVLVATALHRRAISLEEIQRLTSQR